jgi:hypothetical protein
MSTKTMGRNGGNRATRKTADSRNHTATASRIKALIVRLAVCGLLPVGLAECIIRRLHLGGAS